MEVNVLPSEFEWDKHNSEHIKKRHDMETSECEEIFTNLPLMITSDTLHSHLETRYHAIGKTNMERVLHIVFTIRSRKIRVITARDASRKERRFYHETV